MKEQIVQKDITNTELLRYMTDQFERVFIMLDSKAGRADIVKLSKDVSELRKDFVKMRTEVSDLRSELRDAKDELKGDIQSLRRDTNQRFFALRNA